MAKAAKIPKEIRSAAKKLGARLVKTTKGLAVPYQWDVYERYVEMRKKKTTNHSCAYGVFCASVGISLNETLKHYLYAQTSAMVTNCVKSIPLSQSVGQQILVDCYPLMDRILEEIEQIPEGILYALRRALIFAPFSMNIFIPVFICHRRRTYNELYKNWSCRSSRIWKNCID